VFEDGAAVNVVPVAPPGFQVNEAAPLAVNVAVFPGQIVAEGTLNVGVGVTDTLVVFDPAQDKELVAVTV